MTKTLVNVINRVNSSQIKRTTNDRGDPIIVISSKTLPDNIVMNRVLYSAEENEKSYTSLENTLAPIGHPVDAQGNYISAYAPEAIDYHHVGAYNTNVRRVKEAPYGYRVHSDIVINEKVALRTDEGKRLIDAINKGEPIHTSTGVMTKLIPNKGIYNGKEYDFVASESHYDHNAILLDEEGAATPEDGVGLMVNSQLFKELKHDGKTLAVNTAVVPEPEQESKLLANIKGLLDNFYQRIANHGETQTTTNEGTDMSQKHVESVLKANNIDFSQMDEEAKMKAYDNVIIGNAAEQSEEPKGEQSKPQGEVVVNADVQKLIADTVAEALRVHQEQAQAGEKQALADKLKANGVELEEADVKKMSVNALQKLVDKTTQKTSYGVNGGRLQNNAEDYYATTLPKLED